MVPGIPRPVRRTALLLLVAVAAWSPRDVAGQVLESVTPERAALLEAIESREWIIRAVAAMRLEKPDEPHADLLLERLLRDRDWRVRAFTVRSIARRPGGVETLNGLTETDPRVLRVAMLYGARPDPRRLLRRIALELRARTLARRITGIELAALSGDPDALARAEETMRRLVATLEPADAAVLGRRLGAACGIGERASVEAWRKWIETAAIAEGGAIRPRPRTPAPPPPAPTPDPGAEEGNTPAAPPEGASGDAEGDREDARIARLSGDRFVRFMKDYLVDLKARPVELVICLDRTGSMRHELEAAKAGAVELVRFLGDVSSRLRVGLVTYAGQLGELRHLALTTDYEEIEAFLWQTQVGRGARETVLAALRAAIEHNRFNGRALRVVVLIGDEPYEAGNADDVRALVEGAAADGVIVSAVNTLDRKPDADAAPRLPAWDRIAEWGGGRSVHLDDSGDLIELIIALTIGRGWGPQVRDLLEAYRECVP